MHLNIDKLVNKNRDYYNVINSLNHREKPYFSIKMIAKIQKIQKHK